MSAPLDDRRPDVEVGDVHPPTRPAAGLAGSGSTGAGSTGSGPTASMVVDDVSIRYVGQTGAPSIRATARWIRRGDRPAVEVVVTDADAASEVDPVAVALVALRPA